MFYVKNLGENIWRLASAGEEGAIEARVAWEESGRSYLRPVLPIDAVICVPTHELTAFKKSLATVRTLRRFDGETEGP